jgi:hypothetical protein
MDVEGNALKNGDIDVPLVIGLSEVDRAENRRHGISRVSEEEAAVDRPVAARLVTPRRRSYRLVVPRRRSYRVVTPRPRSYRVEAFMNCTRSYAAGLSLSD